MAIQTFGVLVFLAWVTYLLVLPADKINLPFVAILIGITMFCIGGSVLLIGYLLIIAFFWGVTRL